VSPPSAVTYTAAANAAVLSAREIVFGNDGIFRVRHFSFALDSALNPGPWLYGAANTRSNAGNASAMSGHGLSSAFVGGRVISFRPVAAYLTGLP
jgi:hypothetical protein